MVLHRNRRGVTQSIMDVFLPIILILFFALLAFSFYAGGGKQTVENFSAWALSKANVGAIPLPPITKLIPASMQERYFNASITLIPGPPYCQGENITLSAYGSKLPKNVTTADIDCTWDLNTSKDTNCSNNNVAGCNDKRVDNDADLTGCEKTTDYITNMLGQRDIKLTVTIARGETGLGETKTAKATISNMPLDCACDTRNYCTPFNTTLVGNIIQDQDEIKLIWKGPLNVDVTGIHIKIFIDQPSEHLWFVTADNAPYYGGGITLYDAVENITPGYYMIDGNTHPAAGRTFVEHLNYMLDECKALNKMPCEIPMIWYETPLGRPFTPYANIEIVDVNIPYELD